MSDTSQGPGWWLASDGKWYPPEQHPSRQPGAEGGAEPTVVASPGPSETLQLPHKPRPGPVRRTVWADLAVLWHERRGLRVAVVAATVLIAVAVLATIVGGRNDHPTKVLTTVPSTVAAPTTAPTTTATSSTTTTPTTTTTVPTTSTVVRTTIPATTVPQATTVPAVSIPTGAFALCKDGTFSFTTDRANACASHGGVQQFYG